MSAKETDRLTVFIKLINQQLTAPEAAEQLNLSVRQVKRIKKRVKKYGAQGLIHRGRGAVSNLKLQQTSIDKILNLLRTVYVGYGPTLATEKLREQNNITVSDETLRTLMIKNNLWKE